MQPPPRVLVERALVALEIRDQPGAERAPLLRAAERIHLQLEPFDAELSPQRRAHHHQLDVDVRIGKAQRFHAELVVLAVASLLRPLVAEHRAAVPQPLRALVEQVVLERRAHRGRRAFGAQRQLSPFSASTKVYISFSTMSVTSPTPRTKSSVRSTIGMRISR